MSLKISKISDKFLYFRDIYEAESILNSDEATLIAGLLVGLNAYDVTIDLKSFNLNEFDLPVVFFFYELIILSCLII